MINNDSSNHSISGLSEIDICFREGNYQKALSLCEEAINNNPDCKSNYWQLGLILLLQGQEEEAQATWLFAMSDGNPEQIERWTIELLQVLNAEANRRSSLEDYSVAWMIRQHIREINPTDINNILQLIDLSITLETYTGNQLAEFGLISLFQNESINVNLDLILHVWKKLLIADPIHPTSLEFARTCIHHVGKQPEFVTSVTPMLYEIAYSFNRLSIAKRYGELFLKMAPDHEEVLRAIADFSLQLNEYKEAIEYAKHCYNLTDLPHLKIPRNQLIINGLMAEGGCTSEVKNALKNQESLLDSLFLNPSLDLGQSAITLYNSSFLFPYVRDTPVANIKIRCKVADFCQKNLATNHLETITKYQSRPGQQKSPNNFNRPLKIGYVSHCLRRHSVGWLSRWLFKHHDREKFQVYAYLLAAENRQDLLQDWYIQQVDRAYQYGIVSTEVAEQIYEDEIDILIDLDSLTLTNTCAIMALKPAPIQVTWLGWDASAIPTIDYFIADPYVLPENAQDYYPETIWRLPQTYIAVDGFEVDLPSLRREDLDLPKNAVVYLSAQRGPKYNPEMAKLQIQIIKEVPNSYLIVKGFGEQESISHLFCELAEGEGIGRNRLRFINRVGLEETHRANLAIADVVLDTYPYNGATTTLETLWMGIPIVTKVGQQFASRNSYTMMMNAGITEGIAWSDEDYVEWGIRLGRNEDLRKQVSWKLRQSKRTAPLWNANKFARQMEEAYQKMWEIYMTGEQ